MAKESLQPTESEIHGKFFREFLKDSESVIVKNWSGWSYKKGRRHREQTRFYREFDIAVFSRTALPAEMYELKLTGYEVKGWRKGHGGKMIEPPFGEGIDQALVLLQQGADYAYVIYPEPKNDEYKSALKELCDRYARDIGIIFTYNDLSWRYTFREAGRNVHTNTDRKKKLLNSLTTGGNYSDISELPMWVKRQQY